LGSSGIGVGYLDILLNEFTGGDPIDPGLFERIKATFTNDIHACLKLSEIVDDLQAGSVDALAPEKIIPHLWSEHPELAKELNQLLSEDGKIQGVMESTAHDEQSDLESDDDETLHEPPLYCFCSKGNSGTMIACENFACPRGWFHLHCINLVVTPDQDKKWFCSENCRKIGERFTEMEQERVDHGV
jgi:hypothetical protein